MALIDKKTIRAEIERRINALPEDWIGAPVVYEEYQSFLAFLDTLPQQPVGEEYALQLGKFTHTLRVGSKADIDRLIRQEKQQPVEGLEEAARSYSDNQNASDYPDLFTREDIKSAFIAGAEWMAGQGVSADSEVCKLADRAWVTPTYEKKFAQDVFDNFVAGDKVIVQIRKK